MIYYLSDNHFNHGNLIDWLPTRKQFTDAGKMDHEMATRIKATVGPNDILYYGGDWLYGSGGENIKYWRDQFNFEIYLALGNHDKTNPKKLEFIRNAGFADVQEEYYINDNYITVWLNHYPYGVTWDKRGLLRPEATQPYDVALGGHIHSKWLVNDMGSINICADMHDFYPQTLQQLLQKIQGVERFPSSKRLEV